MIHGLSRLVGDFKLHRSLGFLLHDLCAGLYSPALSDIANPDFYQIAAAQFTVNCQIEHRKVSYLVIDLKPNSDSPNLLGRERRFLSSEFAFVPGDFFRLVRN